MHNSKGWISLYVKCHFQHRVLGGVGQTGALTPVELSGHDIFVARHVKVDAC